jgi:hypothetical protein
LIVEKSRWFLLQRKSAGINRSVAESTTGKTVSFELGLATQQGE